MAKREKELSFEANEQIRFGEANAVPPAWVSSCQKESHIEQNGESHFEIIEKQNSFGRFLVQVCF